MKRNRPLRVAMLVVDGNDVAGDQFRSLQHQSPSVHPAIQGLLDGLTQQEDLECYVLYGTLNGKAETSRRTGSVIYVSVPYRRLPLPGMGYVGRLWCLLRKLHKLNPDLVHGQGTERESALTAVLSGFTSVITLHGNFIEITKIMSRGCLDYYRITAWIEKLTLQRADAIICISNYVREITVHFSAKKYLVPNPVREQFIRYTRPEQPIIPRIICLGTIDPRKQTHLILEACVILWKQGKIFELHVYGLGGYSSEYTKSFMSALEIWKKLGNAYYHGMVKDPAYAISTSQVMVSASKEESFGMNVLEAMALGTPVVAPFIGGIKDIIEHDISGLNYSSDDTMDCAAKIKSLLESKVLWQRISLNGRNRAKDHFSSKLVATKVRQVYNDLIHPTIPD